MRISDWSSDVCSSDLTVYPSHYEGWGLPVTEALAHGQIPVIADNSSLPEAGNGFALTFRSGSVASFVAALEKMVFDRGWKAARSEEHTSELQSLLRSSYAVFGLNKNQTIDPDQSHCLHSTN